jgi:hypothetical protein
MKYALLNSDNFVLNCIEWDGESPYDPGDAELIPADGLYVGPGFTWNGSTFIPPQPYPSWEFDEITNTWEAPVSSPTEGGPYTWDETTQQWVTT